MRQLLFIICIQVKQITVHNTDIPLHQPRRWRKLSKLIVKEIVTQTSIPVTVLGINLPVTASRSAQCIPVILLNQYVLKSIIFWDMTSCSLLSSNWRFGGTPRHHLQGQRNNLSKNQQISDMFFRNVGCNSTDYTASYPRRWYSSEPLLWKPQILRYVLVCIIHVTWLFGF
jgi:hypothetical protein